MISIEYDVCKSVFDSLHYPSDFEVRFQFQFQFVPISYSISHLIFFILNF